MSDRNSIWNNPRKPKYLVVYAKHMDEVQFSALCRCLTAHTITTLTNKGLKIESLTIDELERIVCADEFWVLPDKNDLAILLHNLALMEIRRRVYRNRVLTERYGEYKCLDW